MPDRMTVSEYQAAAIAIEPAARIVPPRALRRAIRLSRDRGTFRPRALHERCWWVRRDELFQLLTPAELDLSPNETSADLLLIPAPELDSPELSPEVLWRTLFHAKVDKALATARQTGRLSADIVRDFRNECGPARWHTLRTVLQEENLIDESDPDDLAYREFLAFGLELARFAPEEWSAFFPGLAIDGEPFRSTAPLLNVDYICARTKPTGIVEPTQHSNRPAPAAASTHRPEQSPEIINDWVKRGNDLKAAVLLVRTGDDAAWRYLDRLIHRFTLALKLNGEARAQLRTLLIPLLEPASRGGWPIERRLLYELQRACLAIERTTYSADLIEWIRSLGRRPIKRPLPKTRWLEAARRLRAALGYAERLASGHHDLEPLVHLLAHGMHACEIRARDDLRPELVAVLDEVGLVPQSVPERLSREKLVEELLDAACARGFLRIGDLRDAIARSRVKLADLRGPGELFWGDPIIRANAKLPLRLDGVYRRGEIYMRLLQRGCSLAFGTRVGRWLTLFVALPFGGAFILLEALVHLYDAAEGLVNWLSGWTATVNGVSLVGGGLAGTLAANPTLEPGGASWKMVVGVGVVLLLLLHWPAFRNRFGQVVRFTFIKVPRIVRRSPYIRQLVHNPLTRFFRRYLLLPLGAGGAAALTTHIAGADESSVALVGGGMALLAGTFFRTPLGRELEDRCDEAMQRVWRVVSVNFAIGILTLILHFFHRIFEAIDQSIHAVDEWLRFREGEGRLSFAFKMLFGAGWFVFTYIFRFAWNLLVEPQINPIKHFPVVTVSHKILIPLIGPLAKQFGIAKETMTTIVFGIPGIFGFLVWELKENWKLYRTNSPKGIGPIQVGAHGETVRGLLRPGFHSGTVPKAFAKLRRAVRSGAAGRIAKYHHVLDHVAEAVNRFVERSFIAYLRTSRRWAGRPITLSEPVLTPNRMIFPVQFGAGHAPVEIVIDERNGWLTGSVPDARGLQDASMDQRAAFADALVGLYKRAGVHFVREQMAAAFGPQAFQFDSALEGPLIPLADGTGRAIDPTATADIELLGQHLPIDAIMLSKNQLLWETWLTRWDADAAGTAVNEPLIPGWTVLPLPTTFGATGSPTR